MSGVTVVDYGMGNLLSVMRAFEHCGAEVILADSPAGIERAGRLVLPGVGAFADGMEGLRKRDLVGPVRAFAASGRPFLGICLGMQMMLEWSEEFGEHEGLGLIPGKVIAIPPSGVDGSPHKIPHIGWNGIFPLESGGMWAGSILEGLPRGASMYYVHSFMAVPRDESQRLADSRYDGIPITGVIRSGSAYGCQFHPEKSGEAGLRIIRNFIGFA